jgi:hypothetical protein
MGLLGAFGRAGCRADLRHHRTVVTEQGIVGSATSLDRP